MVLFEIQTHDLVYKILSDFYFSGRGLYVAFATPTVVALLRQLFKVV